MATSKKPKANTKRQPVKSRLSSSGRLAKTSSAKPRLKKRAVELSIFLGRDRKIGLRIELSSPARKKPVKATQKSNSQNKTVEGKFQKIVTTMLITLGLSGTIFFGIQYKFAPSIKSPGVVVAQQIKSSQKIKSLSQSNAKSISISSIGINAPVEMVGQAEDNSISVPSDGDKVGQYTLAPTPGERGPAILVGHVDTFLGPAVFWRLHQLSPGQTIDILRSDGSTASFRIYDVQQFSQDNFPNERVYGNTAESELRLITCAGSFNFIKQRYDKNTVVFARLI